MAQGQGPGQPPTYAYRVERFDAGNTAQMEARLNQMAQHGWRAVAFIPLIASNWVGESC